MGRKRGQVLPITIQGNKEATVIALDESIVEPSAAKLSCEWMESASRLTWRQLSLDLRTAIVMDAEGGQVLPAACAQAGATAVAGRLRCPGCAARGQVVT